MLRSADKLRLSQIVIQEIEALKPVCAVPDVASFVRRVTEETGRQVELWGIDFMHEGLGEERPAPMSLRADADTALQFYRRGATVYLRHLEVAFPSLRSLLQKLEAELGLPAGYSQVEALLSRPGTGARLHFDADCAINLQLRGQKRWWVYPNEQIDNPLEGANPGCVSQKVLRHAHSHEFLHHMPADALSFDAEPGTVVWLPRGCWHQTLVGGHQDSLAIVFCFKPPTHAQLLTDRLRTFLERDPQWRAFCHGSQGTEAQQRRYLTSLLDKLNTLQGTTHPKRFWEDAFYDLPETIGARWVFVSIADVQLQLEETSEGQVLTVETEDEVVDIPLTGTRERLLPLVRWLLRHRTLWTGGDAIRWLHAQRLPAPPTPRDVARLILALVDAGAIRRRPAPASTPLPKTR